MRRATYVVLFLCLQFARFSLAQSDTCLRWGAVVDSSHELSRRHEFRRMQKLFCSATEHSHSAEDATTAASSAGISIPVVEDILSFKFGTNYGASSATFDQWRYHFCSMNAQDASITTNFERAIRRFSDNATKVAIACYENNRPGMHGKITPSSHKSIITIELRYQPLGDEVANLTKPVKVVPSDALAECDANNLFGSTKRFSTGVVTCKWDSRKDLAVDVNTDHGTLLLSLEADPALPPPRSGDRLQSGYAFLRTPSELCNDPDNLDTVECAWWHTVLQPRGNDTRMVVTVALTANIVKSPCPCTRGCPSDPWRRGKVHLRCGKSSATSGGRGNDQPRDLPSYTDFFEASVQCEADGFPVEVAVVANPRGCSAMSAVDGMVTYKEVQK